MKVNGIVMNLVWKLYEVTSDSSHFICHGSHKDSSRSMEGQRSPVSMGEVTISYCKKDEIWHTVRKQFSTEHRRASLSSALGLLQLK